MGVTLNGIVTPAKPGFLVEMWWGTPAQVGVQETTNSQGKVQFTPGASSWPVAFFLKIPAGQTVDGVTYGEYTSEPVTLYDTQEADIYLYPTKPVEPRWAIASAAIGIALIMLGYSP